MSSPLGEEDVLGGSFEKGFLKTSIPIEQIRGSSKGLISGKNAKAEYLFGSGLVGFSSGLLANVPVLVGSLELNLARCFPAMGLFWGLIISLQEFPG